MEAPETNTEVALAPLVRVSLTGLTFSDGTRIRVPQNAVVVIVGPNNSGKSVALQNIATGRLT